MKNVEKIYESKKLVGLVIRHNVNVSDRTFFTEAQNPLQLAIHNTTLKKELTAHIHQIDTPLAIPEIHEFLYVQKGGIKVTFISKKGKQIAKKILKKNDIVLIMNVSHKVDFLAKSQVVEVKQGPYLQKK